jgi:hypothetical protein
MSTMTKHDLTQAETRLQAFLVRLAVMFVFTTLQSVTGLSSRNGFKAVNQFSVEATLGVRLVEYECPLENGTRNFVLRDAYNVCDGQTAVSLG